MNPVLRKNTLALIGLLAAAFFLWRNILSHSLLNYDDLDYLSENPMIRSFRLSAFFSLHNGFDLYMPLTWLSSAIDWHLGKGQAFYFLLGNLLLHLINGAFVYIIFTRLSKQPLLALLAAAVFLLHPMRVESVAWASQRKDLLYFFFYALAFYTYLLFRGKDQHKFYSAILLLMVGACLSKPMAVSLPLVLMLTDVFYYKRSWKQALLAWWPLLLIALVIALIALQLMPVNDQKSSHGNYNAFDLYCLFAYSLLFYLIKTIAPFSLSLIYVYPEKAGAVLPWPYLVCGIVLPVLIFLLIRYRKQNPLLLLSFLIYTVILLPVLQLVPNTHSPVADRYYYMSGIAAMLVFYFAIRPWVQKPQTMLALGSVGVLVFAVLTWQRIPVFKDSLSVFSDVIRKGNASDVAYNNRGLFYNEQNRFDLGLPDFEKALAINPNNHKALNNYGWALAMQQRPVEAIPAFEKAISLYSKDYRYYSNLAGAYGLSGNMQKAEQYFLKAVEMEPNNKALWQNLAITYQNMQRPDKAQECFRRMEGL